MTLDRLSAVDAQTLLEEEPRFCSGNPQGISSCSILYYGHPMLSVIVQYLLCKYVRCRMKNEFSTTQACSRLLCVNPLASLHQGYYSSVYTQGRRSKIKLILQA